MVEALLRWYERERRDLPWRRTSDPYAILVSEVMLQQTQVARVVSRYEAWLERWPTVASLAAAPLEHVLREWVGLGYNRRAVRLWEAARVVARDGWPERLDDLPGVGPYTAAAVGSFAFGRQEVALDTNARRVFARLGAPLAPPPGRAAEFNQATMELGATVCTARAPRCLACPLREQCDGYATGAPETFPVKAAKLPKPQRYGTMFWLERGGRVLLVRRPAKGLLGGMRALPTGPWEDTAPGLANAPVGADWQLLDAQVRHGFTHFNLDVALAAATIAAHIDAPQGEWWPIAEIEAAGLPTVFAKAARMFGRMHA